jgi:hypothetical protein
LPVAGEHRANTFQPALQVDGPHAGDDRDLALAREQPRRLFAHDPAGGEVIDTVEGHTPRLRRVGGPGDHGNPRFDRTVDGLGQEIAVEAGDGDPVHALGDEGLQDLVLPKLVGVRWSAPDHLHVPQPPRHALGPGARVVEDRQVERLRHHGEAVFRGGAAAAATARENEHDAENGARSNASRESSFL